MRGLFAYMADNGADLLLNLAFCLIVYLVARLLKANPAVALVFAAIPMVMIFLLQNPGVPRGLMAMLG